MRKLAVICAACLVVITMIVVRREWVKYRQEREAAEAATEMERNKPPRFRTLPTPEGAASSAGSERLVVTLDEGGRVWLGVEDAGTLADLEPLRRKLSQALSLHGGEQSDRAVFVRASRSVKYAEVAKVVEAAKQAGAHPVGLEVDSSK